MGKVATRSGSGDDGAVMRDTKSRRSRYYRVVIQYGYGYGYGYQGWALPWGFEMCCMPTLQNQLQ